MPNGNFWAGATQGINQGAISQMVMSAYHLSEMQREREYQQQQKDQARQNELTDYGVKLNMKNNLDLQNQQATDLQKQQESTADAPIVSNLIQGGQNQDLVDRSMPNPNTMLDEPKFNQQFQKYSPSDIANQVGQTHLTPDAKKSFLEYLLKPKGTADYSQFDYSDPKQITGFNKTTQKFEKIQEGNPYYTPPVAKLQKVEGYNSDGNKVVQFYNENGSLHHSVNTGLKGTAKGDSIDSPEQYNKAMNTVTAKDQQRQKLVTQYQDPNLDEIKRQGTGSLINSLADEVQSDAYAHLDDKAKGEIDQLFQGSSYQQALKNGTSDQYEKQNQGMLKKNFMNVIETKYHAGKLSNEQVRGLTLWANGKFGYAR